MHTRAAQGCDLAGQDVTMQDFLTTAVDHMSYRGDFIAEVLPGSHQGSARL